ncbi:unnamed protein product [Hanseniaspora opuntiae]
MSEKNESVEVDDAQTKEKEEIQVLEKPSLSNFIYNCLFSYEYIIFVAVLLVIFESFVLKKIIATVSYTNIDYKAYMEQIRSVIKDNNYQYDTIEGDTGPLVYPAGHYWIFKFLRDLTINWKDNDNAYGVERISEGQEVFRVLYLVTLVFSFLVSLASGSVYPSLTVLLSASYRLHSIYVLRLFNDCFTTFLVLLSILLMISIKLVRDVIIDEGRRNKLDEEFIADDASNFSLLISFGVMFLYSAAVSVKMNALLYLPAVLIILCWLNYNGKNFFIRIISLLTFGVAEQFLIGLPFIQQDMMAYFLTAFNFKRKFMYIWSINWQFISKDTFDSDMFARSLLLLHAMTLYIFMEQKWLSPIKKANGNKSGVTIIVQMIKDKLQNSKTIMMPDIQLEHMVYILTTCNYIGCIFSRSLHYQFLTWYHWSIPVLLSYGLKTKNNAVKTRYKLMKVVLGFVWYGLHELCWNVYMPKWWSSLLLASLNTLLLTLVYINYD